MEENEMGITRWEMGDGSAGDKSIVPSSLPRPVRTPDRIMHTSGSLDITRHNSPRLRHHHLPLQLVIRAFDPLYLEDRQKNAAGST